VKWREFSAIIELPKAIVGRAGGKSGSLVLSGRNLKLWTNYRGTDPENDYTATGIGDAPNEFQQFGAPSIFQVRLNIGF
jgi:hypothetical protein